MTDNQDYIGFEDLLAEQVQRYEFCLVRRRCDGTPEIVMLLPETVQRIRTILET